jgi:hypothetical protein
MGIHAYRRAGAEWPRHSRVAALAARVQSAQFQDRARFAGKSCEWQRLNTAQPSGVFFCWYSLFETKRQTRVPLKIRRKAR